MWRVGFFRYAPVAYWQFKNGRLGNLTQGQAAVFAVRSLRDEIGYAWDRALGAAVFYDR